MRIGMYWVFLISLVMGLLSATNSITYLAGVCGLVEGAHDEVIGGATVRVNEHDLAGVDAVHGNQLANEDLIRWVLVEDLEAESEWVSDLGGGQDVAAAPVGDLHGDVGRVYHHLLSDRWSYVSSHAQVHLKQIPRTLLVGTVEPLVIVYVTTTA